MSTVGSNGVQSGIKASAPSRTRVPMNDFRKDSLHKHSIPRFDMIMKLGARSGMLFFHVRQCLSTHGNNMCHMLEKQVKPTFLLNLNTECAVEISFADMPVEQPERNDKLPETRKHVELWLSNDFQMKILGCI